MFPFLADYGLSCCATDVTPRPPACTASGVQPCGEGEGVELFARDVKRVGELVDKLVRRKLGLRLDYTDLSSDPEQFDDPSVDAILADLPPECDLPDLSGSHQRQQRRRSRETTF